MKAFICYPKYRTRAITTRDLYIFYPIFEEHFFVFKEVFSGLKVLQQILNLHKVLAYKLFIFMY